MSPVAVGHRPRNAWMNNDEHLNKSHIESLVWSFVGGLPGVHEPLQPSGVPSARMHPVTWTAAMTLVSWPLNLRGRAERRRHEAFPLHGRWSRKTTGHYQYSIHSFLLGFRSFPFPFMLFPLGYFCVRSTILFGG